MNLSCGIVGLPNAGKSTIFNALTSAKALVANYPFTTIDPNVGIVNVPDERLNKLEEIIKKKRIVKIEKASKSGNKEAQAELGLLERLTTHISQGKSARLFLAKGDIEEKILAELSLLTIKPVLYVANLEEKEGQEFCIETLRKIAEEEKDELIEILGIRVSDLLEFSEEESKAFLSDMGLTESGLRRLIKAAYKLLNLITFYTTNGIELRAWTVKQGTNAPKAGGDVDSGVDIGCIKAEVISYE